MSPRSFPACLIAIRIAVTIVPSAYGQDATAGARVFKADCSICHAIKPNRNLTGPSLFGVVNRPAGSVRGFHYSAANRHSGIVWSPRALDRYLSAPRQVVPGTLMTFPGLPDGKQRSDLIAFLETLH